MKFLSILTLFLFTGLVGFSQNKIIFSGKITNTRNEPVAGASISFSPGNFHGVTDADGNYSIDLPARKGYVLTVTHVNYQSKKVAEIDVAADSENSLNVVLENSAKSNLDQVVVTATTRRQESTNALLTFQKNNTALSSGIAADFIKRTPDKNTSEVLRRVSGTSIQDNKFVIVRGLADRYNAAFINGAALPSSEPDKKSFSFDVIPSALVDNIIINKTATPDLTGEFAGGLVQIQTKDIPAKSQLIVGASLGFNTISFGKDFISNERGQNDWLGFTDTRKLPATYPRKYGEYNKLSLDDRIAISRELNDRAYDEVQSKAGPIQQYNLTWANAIRNKNGSAIGTILGVNYQTSKLKFQRDMGLYENSGDNPIFQYFDKQNKYGVNLGAVANIAWTYKKNKVAFKNLFNQLFEDNYYNRNGVFEDQDVLLRSSVLNQRSLYSAQLEGQHDLSFLWNSRFNWNLNFALNNKEVPDLRVQSYLRQSDALPYSLNLRGNNSNRFFSDLNDKIFGYNTSLSIPFNIGAQKQNLKIGGAATARIREFQSIILGFNEPSDQSLMQLPYNQAFNKDNFRTNGFVFTSELQNPQDKYFGASVLSAGYLMFDNKLSDKFRLVWGARGEYFEQFLKTNLSQKGDTAMLIDVNKFDLLPSMNLTFSPNFKTNVRLGVSQTVARPEFREIAPFSFYDFEQVASTQGNENLQRSKIINTDLRYEYYPKGGEVLSIGAFYKNFADPIELRLNSASVGSRRQYQYQNGEKAELTGVEVEFRKALDFVGNNADGFLSKLYVNGNASFIKSKVTLANTDGSGAKLESTQRPLQGQSPYLVNLGLSYDGEKGTSFSALYNRVGDRMSLVGNENFGDIYEKARDLVDLQLSQKVMKEKGEVKLTVKDVLGQRIAAYESRDNNKRFNEGTDKYFYSYKPGTTFTIGFTYNLDLKK